MEYLSDALHEYIAAHTTAAPPLLDALERETWLKVVMPRMLSGHVQGQFLKFISQMARPKYLLEVGTFTGYASHFLVEGLQPDGEFHAIEINEELEPLILKYWDQNPKRSQMNLHIGPASELLPLLDRPWDLVFLDADKIHLIDYYNVLVPRMPKGGILLIDNTLWSGKVAEPVATNDRDTQAIVALNKHVAEDPRVEQVLLSVRDGILLVKKL